jgi:hypothetical protein
LFAAAKNTEEGVRAVHGSQAIDPASARRHLESKFGEDLSAARSAMQKLAQSYAPKELADRSYSLYERFRPAIPSGVKGWRAQGELDLGLIERLAKEA